MIPRRMHNIFVVDTSSSMEDYIEQLKNAQIFSLHQLISFNPARGVEYYISLIPFDSSCRVLLECVPITQAVKELQKMVITAQRATNTGLGLLTALELGKRYETQWAQEGLEFLPTAYWLFSDGKPCAGINPPKELEESVAAKYAESARLLRKGEAEGTLNFVAISLNNADNVEKLRELTNDPGQVVALYTQKGEEEFKNALARFVVGTVTSLTNDDGFKRLFSGGGKG